MLNVSELCCRYGDVIAVDRINLSVAPGEILGLVGANGAGKTSTIMAIAGLLAVKSGSVVLNDKDITALPPHHRIDAGIALVPEGRRIFADLTVAENLIVGGTRLNAAELRRYKDQVSTIFPRLAERQSQLAGSLSGGEQQMLAIGRALVAQPSVLLVDELSLGLMPIAIDECYGVLESLREENIAIIIVEQSTERVLDVADRIIILESGRAVWHGNGADARQQGAIFDAYLGL